MYDASRRGRFWFFKVTRRTSEMLFFDLLDEDMRKTGKSRAKIRDIGGDEWIWIKALGKPIGAEHEIERLEP